MVLTRRALAQRKNQPQATTTSREEKGERATVVICKDPVDGSTDICAIVESTITDIDGPLQTKIHTHNDPSDQPLSARQHNEKENRDANKPFQSRVDEQATSSATNLHYEETTTWNDAPLPGHKPRDKERDDGKCPYKTSASGARTAPPIPIEVGSATDAEPELEVAPTGLEKEEGRGENEVETPLVQPEGAVRRSQRVRRPTQRYIAGMDNADRSKAKQGSTKEEADAQKVVRTQGHSKRKRVDQSATERLNEDDAASDVPAEESRRIRRRVEERGPMAVRPYISELQYTRTWQVIKRHIVLGAEEEVTEMGSWNRFTIPRPVSDIREERSRERLRDLAEVASKAKKLETP